MKKLLIGMLMFPLGIAGIGCGGPIVNPSVYGASGKKYQAPTICAALVQCLQTDTKCYYDTYAMPTTNGVTDYTAVCKKVTK